MNRRMYLIAVVGFMCAIAGCTSDSGDEEETPDDAEVVFQDVVGTDPGMDTGGGNGGGGGDIGGGSGGDFSGGSGDGSGYIFTQELEAGEQLEVQLTNQAYATEYEIYAPDGETLVDEAIDEESASTIEAEQDGEYDVMINPDGGSAEVVIIVHPPE